MNYGHASAFVRFCDTNRPTIADWKFQSGNQLAVVLLKDNGGWKYEVHLHYAWLGNGILTGANIRWQGETSSQSVTLDTGSSVVRFCDNLIREGTNYNFSGDMGTRFDI